jgi:beta-lactam-binding protein with PASTA domain
LSSPLPLDPVEEQSRIEPIVKVGLVVAVTVTTAGLVGSAAATSTSQKPEARRSLVSVPALHHMYLDGAVASLRRAGLRPVLRSLPGITAADLSVNGYAVLTQAPRGGTRVRAGSFVLLNVAESVNGGPGGLATSGIVLVPQLRGLMVQAAFREGLQAGLRVTVLRFPHRLALLSVRRQTPRAGATVPAGTNLVLALR